MPKTHNFISANYNYCTLDKNYPAPYLRRTFTSNGEVDYARLKITGLGFYELHFNKKNITKGLLAPYRSNPDHIVYFDEYDVVDILRDGKNVIAVILGNGMQNPLGAYNWDFDNASWRSAPKLYFELAIKYKNGDIKTIVSDTKTRTAPSPILFDDLHYGEYYDASLEIANWDDVDFDDTNWANAVEAETPNGEFRLCEAEPIVIRKKIKPVSVTEYDGGYIYDFGLNNAGLCEMYINNSYAGQKVLLQYFETLKDGKPYFDNIRFNKNGMIDRYQEDIYYCAGKKREYFKPHFTYHGFRYVYVTGITPEQATEALLTYLIMNSDIKQIGGFKCDDEVINKIQEATVRSDLSNFYYFPTDCPQREKNGWTADASLSAEQMLLNIKPEISYREWMRNVYKALNEKGQLPGIVPTTGWGYEWGNGPGWDGVIINIPYYTYIYRGDKEILKEMSQPLMCYLQYLESRLDENNLIAIGLGDWCPPGVKEDHFETPLVVTDTILTYDIATKSAFAYEVLGMKPQKLFADKLAKIVKTAFRENLLDKKSCAVKGNTQTGQAMAIYYGLLTEREKTKAFDLLVKYIDDEGGHFKTGVLGGRVIYRVLADNGMADLAYNMIVRPDYPSYGNWIKRGATTLWEGFYPENGRILSLNHHFWGDVSAWFYIYLAGIRINPSGNDVNEVNISPCFVENLSFVEAEHILPSGRIKVKWVKIGKIIKLDVSIPEKIYGLIVLQKGYKFFDMNTIKKMQPGEYSIFKYELIG